MGQTRTGLIEELETKQGRNGEYLRARICGNAYSLFDDAMVAEAQRAYNAGEEVTIETIQEEGFWNIASLNGIQRQPRGGGGGGRKTQPQAAAQRPPASRPAARTGRQVHAQTLGQPFHPARCSEGATAPNGVTHGLQLLLGQGWVQPLTPVGLPGGFDLGQACPHRRFVNQIESLAKTVDDITRPGIAGQVRHHAGAQRIGLYIAHYGQHVFVFLDQGTLERALPNMPASTALLMVMPGVGHA